jgi:transcriptional regulator with GAF, ATPase, and Fis domain
VTRENLKRILSKKGEAATIISDVMGASGMPWAIWDTDGYLLLGAADAEADEILEKHSILDGGEVVGWTSGGAQAPLLAALLTHLVAREAEKEELLEEVLDLYRQVNLLFNLSDKLAASLELNKIAGTTLREASRLIETTGGAIVLSTEEQAYLPVAAIGQGIPAQGDPELGGGIVGAVVASARAEIINDVRADERYAEGQDSIRSLICAPLTSKRRRLGAIVIVSEVPVTYTAGDLKLLETLASQATPAIDNALLHEKALREAKRREDRLRRQVQELRIELDEARQKEKVAEITGSEYYQRLRDRADALRSIIGG